MNEEKTIKIWLNQLCKLSLIDICNWNPVFTDTREETIAIACSYSSLIFTESKIIH